MSKINNKNILIEKKIKVEGCVQSVIEEGCEAIGNFMRTCKYIQESEFKEAELLGFGFYKTVEDPKNTYRVFINLCTFNCLKKYFEHENYGDISVRITDTPNIPNEFTPVEEVANGTE